MSSNKKSFDLTKLTIVLLFISGIVCISAGSYAMFLQIYKGEKVNQITTGTLILKLDEGDGINLISSIPVSDEKGLLNTPYTFSVRNTGTVGSQYKISIIDDEASYASDGCSDNRLEWSNIKYSLEKNGEVVATNLLSVNSAIIDSGLLTTDETNTYSLKLWIDSSATNEIMGKHFHGKVKIEGIMEGHTDYTTGI